MEFAIDVYLAHGVEDQGDARLGGQIDIETLVASRCRVAEDVVILPDDGIADVQFGGHRSERHLVEHDGVVSRVGG